MPKVVVNNTKGLFQKTGGGLSLFGGTQAITAVADGANAPIAATTSFAIVSSDSNSKQVDLPAIAGVEVGHTILLASVGSADVVVETPSSETINGASNLTLGENVTALIVKATATTWVAIIS